MKTVNLLKLSAAALFLVATSASAVITGSAHDFSALGWNTGGEICEACHAPHNNQNTAGEVLWNHDITATATFILYSNPASLDATPLQPQGSSKLCLSCHDGTVALDSFGGATGTTFITGTSLVGTDLSNDHPISFAYSTGGTGLNLDTGLGSLGGTIATDNLESGNVECVSCHDVHNAQAVAALLLEANTASALCLRCHAK